MECEIVDAVRPSQPWLRLRLLGGCEFHCPDGSLHPETAKTSALLAFLAMQSAPQQRHKLMGLLWGDLPEPNARRNLRRALWDLRHKLSRPDAPPFILASGQTVEFNRDSSYWLDVEAFSQRVNEVMRQRSSEAARRQGNSLTHQFVTSLTEAVRLYRGDFLEGFYVRGAPAFEEWMLAERERLRQMALQVLHYLVRHHAARGEYAAGIEYATRLLAMDPWREEAHRELMRLLALAGQRSAALAQYEECRRLLQTELGLEPLEETTALYEQIRSATPLPLAPPLPSSPAPPLPFVGRGEEHAMLVGWWEMSRCGQGRLALVEGEAGVGKTRLVEEVARYAETQGAVVLRGRCYEFGTTVPYQPIAEALRGCLHDMEIPGQYDDRGTRGQGDTETRRRVTLSPPPLVSPSPLHPLPLSPVWLAELARLLPELRQHYPDLPVPVQVSGEAARQRLFEAVACFLLALTGKTSKVRPAYPLFLFLDDLHWADPATLDLLHYLVRQLKDAPVWIVGTYRPEEVGPRHALTRLRQGLSRDHLIHLLTLRPLSATAVGEIARSLLGGEPAEALGDYLYEESEGNPFVLVETVYSLREQGALADDAGGRPRWQGPPAAHLLPTSIRDMILQRVNRLSPPARRLLTLAAVIGRQFDASLLRAAAGPDAYAVDESLEEWLARRLVKEVLRPTSQVLRQRGVETSDSGLRTLDFTHDKIRAVVYHAAGGRQPMLHRRVGEALERLHAGQLKGVCEQLAHHYEQAGATDRALIYLPLAAARARTVCAHQEALDYYDRALAMLGERDERRWEILLSRGQVLCFLARYDEAIADCQQVIEAKAGDPAGRLLAARAATELSAIYRIRRDYDQARSWGERGYKLAEGPGEGLKSVWLREQARAREMLGEVEREQGNLEVAQKLFEEALALQRTLADQRGVADCLNGLGRVLSTRGLYAAACERYAEALAIFRTLGDQQGQATCLRRIGNCHWRQGDNDAARRVIVESLDLCRAIGDRYAEARCLSDLGLVYIGQRDDDAAQRCWEQSAALYRSLGLEKRMAYCLHNLGILHMGRSDYAAAEQCLDESLTVHRAIGARAIEALDLGWLGKLRLYRGEYEDARRCLEAALALDQEVGGGEEMPLHLAWLGAVTYELGDLAVAAAHFEEALRLSEKQQGTNLGPFEICWLITIQLAQGNGEAALGHLRQELVRARSRADADEAGQYCALLGAAEDARPYFEQALALLRDGEPFAYGVALRRCGAYLLCSGAEEQGRTRLREAQDIFERIGAKGELDKVNRLLAGDASLRLRW